MLWVFLLLGACVTAFIANRPRMDVVALIALVAMVASGTLEVSEALAGFSDESVLLIAAFFIIGEGLVRTGVAFRVGDWLINKAGSNETRLLILLMIAVAGLGSFMSSTGVVAIFIPVVLAVAAKMGVAPARLMMPLSFAALISGMMTLVATPPNLVVSSQLQRAGAEGFDFFAFTPFGLVILALGIAYMLFARRFLDKGEVDTQSVTRQRRRLQDLAEDYRLAGRAHRLRVLAESPLIGKRLDELQLRARFGANALGIERVRRFRPITLSATASREVLQGDIVLMDFTRSETELESFCEIMKLQPRPFEKGYLEKSREMGMAEVTVPPESSLVGKNMVELGFRSQYGLNVVGLRRKGEAIVEDFLNEKLRFGDTLLVAGTWKAIRVLQTQSHDFIVLSLPAEIDEAAPAAQQAPFALLSLAVAVGLMISGVVPNVIAAFIGCLLMGAFRCIDMDSAYRSIHWQSLILIVGMLPFALALRKTGGIDLIVSGLLEATGTTSPRMVLASLFLLTAVVGLFISNTATAVLMAPIGIDAALKLGVSPYPFAMVIAVAASAAFMTPVSSPVNTLVLGPGRYRFLDFVKIGVPFTLIVMVVSILLLPWLFPFLPR